MEIIIFIGGMLLGAGIVWFILKNISKSDEQADEVRLQNAEQRVQEYKDRISELQQKSEKESQEIIQLNRSLSQKETEQKGLMEKVAEQKNELLEIQKKLTAEFKNLANEILEEKSKKFTDLNKNNLDGLLKPLGEKLGNFEKKVEQANKDNLERNSALREQIKNLRELNIQVTKEAENLTKALKGDTKSQGNWGEMILERILESSGLEKDREYKVQGSITNDEGKRLQPDVVIQLPDDKNLIVDSKVSLIAYERFVSSEDDQERQQALKDHLISIRGHIKGLSEKNYQSLYGMQGLDFVLMFIPMESAFSLGVQADPDLFTGAYEKNIVIVSPTTLLATLRTIASIWRNEKQNQNAMKIAQQASDLYDKFVGFSEDLITLGRQLDTTKNTYSAAMNKLSEGKGNLVSRAERIRKLGAAPSKQIHKKLIERGDDSED